MARLERQQAEALLYFDIEDSGVIGAQTRPTCQAGPVAVLKREE
jgi:hypothetical protein